jgi:error-prone DNA polymerase
VVGLTERFAHLHTASHFSFGRGISSPSALVERARALGQPAVALTDWLGVSGAVQFQDAARDAGLRAVVGAEVPLEGGGAVVLLCMSNTGYANLNRLLTQAWTRPDPHLEWNDLEDCNADLILLTGGYRSPLRSMLEDARPHAALEWLTRAARTFAGRTLVELVSHHRPGDARVLAKLAGLARTARVPPVVTGEVLYALPSDMPLFDAVNCARLKITVADEHDERPVNDEAHLKSRADLERLMYSAQAFDNSLAVAERCTVDLLPGEIRPPGAGLPDGVGASEELERLCRAGLSWRYPADRHSPERRRAARAQMARELEVIGNLDLSEFFLVVHEVVQFARARGIRHAGRGSAANSICAYLLGITGVDPLEQHLLFERFLHGGRQGTPDIDIDFQSDRRAEVIAWLEARFKGHTAMTANYVSYGARTALTDIGKVLGFDFERIKRATRLVPMFARPRDVEAYRTDLEGVHGPSPLLDVMLELSAGLDGVPRHLGQHSGGMLLARDALETYTPVRASANGVRIASYNKDDVESMGLVKFDVLGLRSLGVVQGAVDKWLEATGERLEVDDIPLDDPNVYDLITAGETLALFQIESPGQMALLAKHQPRDFQGLIAQIALLRPGPIQGNAVHPFVRRARGWEPVSYPHPSLEPILRDTHGILLYQESVMRIVHSFAGFDWAQTDRFRRLMGKFRSSSEMEALREAFVQGARATHPDCALEVIEAVFDGCAKFAGYGFPRSHSAAFAKTVYQTAHLKRYHPAPYMAAVLEHHPGMYSRQTLVHEAQRHGVTLLPPSLERSMFGYALEPVGTPEGTRFAVRFPLESVTGVSGDAARLVLLERSVQPFSSVDDLHARVPVDHDVLEALGKAGALDAFGARRDVLWRLGELHTVHGSPGRGAPLLETTLDLPDLAWLEPLEIAAWDAAMAGASTGAHAMSFHRAALNRMGVVPISRMTGERCTVAGVRIAFQRPPTARGFTFVTLEDESGRVQVIVPPKVYPHFETVLRANALIVSGRVQAVGAWRGLVLERANPLLPQTFDQLTSHPASS